jgi:hypothetical protein
MRDSGGVSALAEGVSEGGIVAIILERWRTIAG